MEFDSPNPPAPSRCRRLVIASKPGPPTRPPSPFWRRPWLFTILSAALLVSPGAADAASRVSVTDIRHWAVGDITRVAIDTTGDFTFKFQRLSNPDRIYFDIINSNKRVGRELIHVVDVGDGRVKSIRVAQNRRSVTRIVFDLGDDIEVTSSRLANPSRLMVEFRPKPAIPPATQARTKTPPNQTGKPANEPPPPPVQVTQQPKTAPPVVVTPAPSKQELAVVRQPPVETPVLREPPRKRIVLPPPRSTRTVRTQPGTSAVKTPAVKNLEPAVKTPTKITAPLRTAVVLPPPVPLPESAKPRPEPKETVANQGAVEAPPKQPAPKPEAPKTRDVEVQSAKVPAAETPEPADALIARPAKRNRSGGHSLTRVLGLKLGRVVIDAGHGGRDTGTIGPSGLREKEVTLDVARRLGKLIEERMGSEVVLTRGGDSTVKLRQRTEIANREQADLFISIHVNSSRYRTVNGVETFYLNFTRSRADLEVAARENAGSDMPMHELSSLVQKIALDDKIQESRDLASNVQTSVYKLSRKHNSAARNRGVKKAPFVVLIGAQMPSVLVEMGFISNSHEEKLLKTSAYRQEVAEALYDGISRYAGSLSHFQVARANAQDDE